MTQLTSDKMATLKDVAIIIRNCEATLSDKRLYRCIIGALGHIDSNNPHYKSIPVPVEIIGDIAEMYSEYEDLLRKYDDTQDHDQKEAVSNETSEFLHSALSWLSIGKKKYLRSGLMFANDKYQNNYTNKQIREYLGHGIGTRKVRISRNGHISMCGHRADSYNDYYRIDRWYTSICMRSDIVAEMLAGHGRSIID